MAYQKWLQFEEEPDIENGISSGDDIKPDLINYTLYQDGEIANDLLTYLNLKDNFSFSQNSQQFKNTIKNLKLPFTQIYDTYYLLNNNKSKLNNNTIYYCKDTQQLYYLKDNELNIIKPDLYSIQTPQQTSILKNIIITNDNFILDASIDLVDRMPNTPISFLMFGGGGSGNTFGGGGGGYLQVKTFDEDKSNKIISIQITLGKSDEPSICTCNFNGLPQETYKADAGGSGKIIKEENSLVYRQAGNGNSGGGGNGFYYHFESSKPTKTSFSSSGGNGVYGGGGGGSGVSIRDKSRKESEVKDGNIPIFENINTKGGNSDYAGGGGSGGLFEYSTSGNRGSGHYFSINGKGGKFGGNGGEPMYNGKEGSSDFSEDPFSTSSSKEYFDIFQTFKDNTSQGGKKGEITMNNNSFQQNTILQLTYYHGNPDRIQFLYGKGPGGGGGGYLSNGGDAGTGMIGGQKYSPYEPGYGGGGGGGGIGGNGGKGGNGTLYFESYTNSQKDTKSCGGGGGGGGIGAPGGNGSGSYGGGGGGYGLAGRGGTYASDLNAIAGIAAGGFGTYTGTSKGGPGIFILSYYAKN